MTIEERLEAASAEARRKVAEREAAHAAFHGRPVVNIKVGRRPGYKGQSVCRDCYYGEAYR